MLRYNDLLNQNYQIAEMKEETNETSLSLDRSSSEIHVSKLKKTTSARKPTNIEQASIGSGQYFVRQATTQSTYQPFMFKSGNTIHNVSYGTDLLLPEEMVVSKTYTKYHSLKSPLTNTKQLGQKFIKKQLQFREGVYSLENPNDLYKSLNNSLPYQHSYSLDNKKIQSFQNQIIDLKSRNQELETMVANLKKDISELEDYKQKNKIQEEKIRELHWKIERQKNLPNLKRVMNSDENYLQEINIINLKQENKILKERVSSLEYDLKLSYSQSQNNRPAHPPSQLEIENRNLLALVDELQKQNIDVTDKLMFAQTFKEKYNKLQAENQQLRQSISDNEKSSIFSCYC